MILDSPTGPCVVQPNTAAWFAIVMAVVAHARGCALFLREAARFMVAFHARHGSRRRRRDDP